MVLVNLTGHRAVYVRPEHIGRLVPSNFAIIEPKGNVNTTYLEWYLNEHPFVESSYGLLHRELQ